MLTRLQPLGRSENRLVSIQKRICLTTKNWREQHRGSIGFPPWLAPFAVGICGLSLVMSQVNIHQAKTHLSRLVGQAASDKEIVIPKAGKPIARLVPYVAKGKARRSGQLRGKIRIKKSFDRSLPKNILASFEGKS